MKTNVRSNTHRNTLRTFLWAGILTMLLPGLPGLSEERIWVGPSGGNWQTASNWSPAGVPKPEDVIVISNSY